MHFKLVYELYVTSTLASSPKNETLLLTKPGPIYRHPLPPGVPGQHTSNTTLRLPWPSSSSHFIIASPRLTDQPFRTKPSASTLPNYVTGLPFALNIKTPHLHTPRTNSRKSHSPMPFEPSKSKPASEPVHYTL